MLDLYAHCKYKPYAVAVSPLQQEYVSRDLTTEHPPPFPLSTAITC